MAYQPRPVMAPNGHTDSGVKLEEWCLVKDDRWLLPRYAALRFLRQTAKTFHFVNRHGEEQRLSIRQLLLRGLSEPDAALAADRLTSSRDLCEQERAASGQRHAKRVSDIVRRVVTNMPTADDGAGHGTASNAEADRAPGMNKNPSQDETN